MIDGDLVTCVLEGVLTSSEENLIRGGGADNVTDSRTLMQRQDADEFVAAVERATGRRVRHFISGMTPAGGGVATEVFVLEPTEGDTR